jgi:glycosyltransferase involved in cell wall biosynthesis
LGDIKYCINLYKLFRREKADIVLSYTVKPVIYASMAAKLAGVKNIYAFIAGTGYTFLSKDIKARIIGVLVKFLYKTGLSCTDKTIFFNRDDMKEFCDSKLVNPNKCELISGSGVNMAKFTPAAYPEKMSFFMLSRLLKCKGVSEYLEAAEIVKKEHPEVKFYLLGKFEYEMSDAIEESVVRGYMERGIVELFPETTDVRPYYEMSSVYVLPSYREGVPRTVLEAMAMARPIITTDANGCRETVVDGLNGFLVPVKNSRALAEAMKRFIASPDLIEKMGAESLKCCAEKFDVNVVNNKLCEYMKITKQEM